MDSSTKSSRSSGMGDPRFALNVKKRLMASVGQAGTTMDFPALRAFFPSFKTPSKVLGTAGDSARNRSGRYDATCVAASMGKAQRPPPYQYDSQEGPTESAAKSIFSASLMEGARSTNAP